MKITIVGAGAWGTALAVSLAAHHQVTLCARDSAQVATMRSERRNKSYLPDAPLPENLELSDNFSAEMSEADLIVIAVPTAGLRSSLKAIAAVSPSCGVIWLCKGFESKTSMLPHQVVIEELPTNYKSGVLSGPSFAQEVARGLPTAMTLASGDEAFARATAQALHHSLLRIYASNDVIGVEVGGAVKNVMAIASGISDGMGLGHNARAALITRGLAEITRLGLKLGGQAETLGGLSGLGDLILTCTGDLSRNRQVGLLLAKNLALPQILEQLGHVAEGVYTVREVHQLAQRLKVEMPISEAVYRVLYEHVPAAEVIGDLLSRAPNREFDNA